jgi:hypothetical protein
VRLACDPCSHRGQHRKETLIARFGVDALIPDVRHLIAECPRRNAPGAACGVFYTDVREFTLRHCSDEPAVHRHLEAKR